MQAPTIFSDIAFILMALLFYLQYSKFNVSAEMESPIFFNKSKILKIYLEKVEA